MACCPSTLSSLATRLSQGIERDLLVKFGLGLWDVEFKVIISSPKDRGGNFERALGASLILYLEGLI